MNKQWTINAKKADANYVLYVATSNEAVQLDKQAGSGSSLIEFARHGRFRSENIRDDDHRDLAIGAFGNYARVHDMQLGAGFRETDLIPKGLKDDWLGGKPGSHSFVVIVYEEAVAGPSSP